VFHTTYTAYTTLSMTYITPTYTKPTQLIGLYSPAPQSGKSTVARCLAARGYAIRPFASPLKEMIATFLYSCGHSYEYIHDVLYVNKETVIESFGVTGRHLMQTLGTEWGRQCVLPDVWLRHWALRVEGAPYVVVDDVRFPNEAQLLIELGGEMWRVGRPGVERISGHASEGGLDAWPHFTQYIVNNGTLTELYDAIAAIPLRSDGPPT